MMDIEELRELVSDARDWLDVNSEDDCEAVRIINDLLDELLAREQALD